MLQIQEQRLMGGERFHVKRGDVSFSVPSVQLEVSPGEVREGSFVLYGPDGSTATGFVLSSQPPMKVMSGGFCGSRETIAYSFDAAGFAVGDQIEGEFRVLSDQGEYSLPFAVRICSAGLDSSLGPVRSLLHFVNLARSCWKEAAALFYHPDFAQIPAQEEGEDLSTLYRALSVRTGNEHNVEEFLIRAGYKQPVTFICEPGEVTMDLPGRGRGPTTGQIRIRKAGWGYTRMKASVSGEFLLAGAVPSRELVLVEADWQEGVCMLPVTILPERMHAGRNFGELVLTPEYGEPIRIPFTVSAGGLTAIAALRRKDLHQTILQMMQVFIDFRTRKTESAAMAEKMGPLIRRLQETDRNNPLTALYRIHYLLTVHREQDALWELQALNRRMYGLDGPMPTFSLAQFDLEEDVVYAYRMYLTILCAEGQEGTGSSVTADALRAIGDCRRRNPDSFWIVWLQLYADTELHRRPSRTFELLREQYDRGCRSPILYMEVWEMVRISATLLYELGDFELQVLLFAARRQLLNESVMTRVNDLARRRKTFSARLFRILTMAYDAEASDIRRRGILESICTLLIRGNCTDAGAFVWYRKGVELGLGITRLLDYYMLSLPADYAGELPQIILLYYSYQNTLPAEQTACLYRFLLEHRAASADSPDSAELYGRYEERIGQFTLEQLQAGRISPNLAALYDRFLTSGRPLSEQTASAAAAAAHSFRIRTTRADARRVVIVYEHYLPEQYCPLTGGTATVSIYGRAGILLEDDEGCRTVVPMEELCEPLMDSERIDALLASYDTGNFRYELYRLERLSAQGTGAAPETEGRMLAAALSPETAPSFRSALCGELLRYYEQQQDAPALCRLLSAIQPGGSSSQERAELLRLMAAQGLWQQAFDWIARFGTNGVAGSVLMRLVSGLMQEGGTVSSEVLAQTARQSFEQGVYDAQVLKCLAEEWDGRTEELEEVRKAAEDFGLETGLLARRMLTQMLFTGEMIPERPLLLEICRHDAAEDEFLINVLAQDSHYCFICGQPMPERNLEMIGGYGMDGTPIPDICRIAWLKDRSERSGETASRDLEITELFLSDLLGRGVVFPFFRQFAGVLPSLQAYADETLVEYRTGPSGAGSKVLFHYAMERDGVRERYEVREMKEMYEGVYVTGFLLFFGEQLHYYITDDPQEKNITASGTLGQDARISATEGDRFSEINRIAMLTAMGRDEEALAAMESYGRRSWFTKRLFDEE